MPSSPSKPPETSISGAISNTRASTSAPPRPSNPEPKIPPTSGIQISPKAKERSSAKNSNGSAILSPSANAGITPPNSTPQPTPSMNSPGATTGASAFSSPKRSNKAKNAPSIIASSPNSPPPAKANPRPKKSPSLAKMPPPNTKLSSSPNPKTEPLIDSLISLRQ